MGFLTVIAFGLAAIVMTASFLRDGSSKAHYREIGKKIIEDLVELFYFMYPSYISDHKIEFSSNCRRRYFLWGKWRIVLKCSFDDSIQVNVKHLVTERIIRVFRKENFQEKVLLQPIFVRKKGR